MLTRAKRARLEKTTFRWLDLESGVWEQIFCHLKGADLRNARQVCSEFYSDASRTIRCLEIGSAYEASEVVPAGEEAIEEQICRLPGALTCLRTVCMAQHKAYLPDVALKLAGSNTLSHLIVNGEDQLLTSETIQALFCLTALRTLTLNACNFADPTALECMAQLEGLRRLEIARCQPHHQDLLQSIAKLTGLTSLTLCKPFCFKDQGYSALSSLSNLQELHIGWTWRLGIGSETLEFLTGLQNLRRLALTKCFVSDAELRWVADLRSLERLEIRSCHNIQGTVFQSLSGLTRLRELDLEGSHMITNEGVRALASITSLQALNLGSSKVTAAAFGALEDMPNLRHLVVPDTMYARPPAGVREKLLPRLKTYRSMRSWRGRAPGRIEEQLQALLNTDAEMMSDPIFSTRILHWFQQARL